MPFELNRFATDHFARQSHQSLVAAIQQTLDVEILLDVLGSGRWQLQFLAARRLEQLAETQDIRPLLQTGLQNERTRGAMLAAMSYLSLDYDRSTLDLVCDQLDRNEVETSKAAAKVIVYQQPELIDSELVSRLDLSQSNWIARQLCYSGRADLIPRVAERLGYPKQRLPPVIGFLVTPEWLGENFETHPSLVEKLSQECGYSERLTPRDAAEYWRKGFMFVGPELIATNIPTKELRKRVFEICYRLLPFDLEMQHVSELEFDARRPLDGELFLAALREADRTNLEQAKRQSPFDFRRRTSPRIVTCSHASVPFVRSQFIEAAINLAQELKVPEQHHGAFLTEHARVELEVDEERRTEADLYLRSRWWTIARSTRLSASVPPVCFPVRQFDDFPWGVEEWLGHRQAPWRDDPSLSPGANVVCRLSTNLGRTDLVEWVRKREPLWRGIVPPIGCELQIPLGDPNTSLLRKQILRRLGIPSPRRPEYRGMVEAAFRPSASWHAMLLGPLLLCELGIIDRPQELALHISIQGDLGDQVRYLATCATFIHAGRRKRPHTGLTRVMSKGLVCRNEDAEQCHPDHASNCRTEIRLHRCFADLDDENNIRLDLSYADDILATHLLATAAMSSQRELEEIYQGFSVDVTTAIERLPPEFSDYLHSDFYQSTGDPHDPFLLNLVPIVGRFTAIRETVRRDELREELEQTFLYIRNEAARRVLKILTESKAEEFSEWDPENDPHSVMPL